MSYVDPNKIQTVKYVNSESTINFVPSSARNLHYNTEAFQDRYEFFNFTDTRENIDRFAFTATHSASVSEMEGQHVGRMVVSIAGQHSPMSWWLTDIPPEYRVADGDGYNLSSGNKLLIVDSVGYSEVWYFRSTQLR